MQLVKQSNTSPDVMPLLAALPYSVILDKGEDMMEASSYDPTSQRTMYAVGRNYSTSREDDSVFNIGRTKNDTKKDD